MNRRSFIERLALGVAGFTILPGAGRVWRAERDVRVYWVHFSEISAKKITDRLHDFGLKHCVIPDFDACGWPFEQEKRVIVIAEGKPSHFRRITYGHEAEPLLEVPRRSTASG